ncbi:MAG: nitroreductase family protein [Clostridia bacterium]|nr:nitroreductase family protein [Clostridia bacterium]
MSFLELAKTRYSVRSFTDEPVKPEDLAKILEAGKVAPTAKNQQPQKIYVLQSEDALEKINETSHCIYGAKTVLMVCKDTTREWDNPLEEGHKSGDQDIAIVATHMMMEAWELGVGSCWVCYFVPQKCKDLFNLPENEEPVMLLPMGYPSENAAPREETHSVYREDDDMVTYI